MRKFLFGTSIFAIVAAAVAFASPKLAVAEPQDTGIVRTVTTETMREALKPLGLDWDETTDSDNLVAFQMKEGDTIRFSIYQYKEDPAGEVSSLGISAGYDLALRLDPRQMNQWNSQTRFSKAYVDADGDPFISMDFALKPGVTLNAITEFVKEFQRGQVKFEKEVLNRQSEQPYKPLR